MLNYSRWYSVRFIGARIAAAATHELMPRRCVFCDAISELDEDAICRNCFADLPWIKRSCPTCGKPMPGETTVGVCCAACQTNPPLISSTIAPLEYAFPIDAAIKALKFRRKLFFIPAFREILMASIDYSCDDIDAILPVPLHRWRHMRRGFNQAAEIAAPISKALQLPTINNLIRCAATPYQSGLKASQRRTNLDAAFRIKGDLSARHVLIVDDVITTGETGRQLAKLLLAAGVEKVSMLAVARA